MFTVGPALGLLKRSGAVKAVPPATTPARSTAPRRIPTAVSWFPGGTRMTGRQGASSSAMKGVLALCAAAATLLLGGGTWGQEPLAPLKTAKAGALGTILVGPSG